MLLQTEKNIVDGIKHNGLHNNLHTLSIAGLHRQTNDSNNYQVDSKPLHDACKASSHSSSPIDHPTALSVFITLASCLFNYYRMLT